MHLSKKTYVKNWSFMTPSELHEITVKKGGKKTHVKPERISYVIEEVGYWRKANSIHGWFVRNVQDGVDDCHEYAVEKDKLKELLESVNAVLADPTRADELLPPQSGFFFGSTEVNEYYIQDLKDTKKILESLFSELKGVADYPELFYRSSW